MESPPGDGAAKSEPDDWGNRPTRPPPPAAAVEAPNVTVPAPPGYDAQEPAGVSAKPDSVPPTETIDVPPAANGPDTDAPMSGEVSVTSSEVDASDVDALLYGIEDEIVIDEDEVEDDADAASGAPAAPGDATGIEIERPASYIPNDEFRKAGGATRSSPPPAVSETKSGSSLFSLQILIELFEKLNLKFPDDTPPKTAEALKKLLLEKTWPDSVDASHELVALTLTAIDPKKFPADRGPWKNGTFQTLLDLLLKRLEEHDTLHCRELAMPLKIAARKRLPTPRRRS